MPVPVPVSVSVSGFEMSNLINQKTLAVIAYQSRMTLPDWPDIMTLNPFSNSSIGKL